MVFTTTGDFFIYLALVITSLRFSRPRALDILDQTLGAFRLGWRPVVAVMFPFGMAFGFNFDSLLAIIGGRFFAGGAIAPSVIRQAGPLVVAMILTAVVGAAVAADLGARKVRDEIDAMRVMGVNPYPRLVIPRILGTAIASPFLYFMGVAAAIIGGFILLVVVRSSGFILENTPESWRDTWRVGLGASAYALVTVLALRLIQDRGESMTLFLKNNF